MFVVKDGKVLLIEKKRGIGAGKINGPGGKIDPGETALECAIRETREEVCIEVINPVKLGELHFAMSDIPDIHCHVYFSYDYTGEPAETEEAVPFWCSVDEIPYEKMWEDDRYWLPQALKGEAFDGKFSFEGESIIWRDVTFGVKW